MHILATAPIDPIFHEQLSGLYPIVTAENDDPETLKRLMPEAICMISRGLGFVGAEILDADNDLQIICRTGAGYENLDIEAATQRGIPVLYAPLLGPAVAEATLAMVLALTKRLGYWHQALIAGQWDKRITERTDELLGKTYGVVGLGRIGREVVKRVAGFDMKIVAYDPFVSAESASEAGVELVELDELLSESDVVSLHALVTPETTGMINRSNIGTLKRGGYLVNFARGGLIDGLDILHEALVDGRLAGVGLDVFPEEPPTDLDHPLFRHPGFLGSPHVLASTAGSEARCSHSVCRDIRAVLDGKRPEWCVNPDVFESPNYRGRR
jgi:phosphoglycerate dehydrogenase-like enzyme